MSDPLAGAPYGQATWTDFTNNWRKVDGDFLQKRSVLRYSTTATRNAMVGPETGQLIYNLELDRLELRKADGSWAGLYTIDGLTIEKVGATTDIKLRNPLTAGSNGLVFTTTLITTQVPFTTAGNELRFEASGLTINTGTKVAKLTTDTANLKSDSPISAPGLISSTTLSVTTTSTFTGNVAAGTATFSGLVTANNYVALTNAPTATNHATNKAYVDAQIATRVPLDGGTMTNYLLVHQDDAAAGGLSLRLRDVSNKPYMDWMDWAGNQLGWIQGTTANLTMYSKGDILLNSGGGQVRTSDAVYTTGGLNRFFNQASWIIGSGNIAYWAYYPNGTSVDSPGTRYGYIGYVSSGHMLHVNEVAGGSMYYNTDYSHIFKLSPNGGSTAQQEMVQFHYAAGVMVGKNGSSTHTTNGHVLWPDGLTYSTVTHGDVNYYVNRLSSVHGERWMYFGVNGTWIGSIYQNGTTGVVFATTCDYRAKTIVGPLTNATVRLMSLKPWRVTWNGDPDRGVTDDFMAHEVADIVPDAVIGMKDAVDEDGNELHQQMAEYRLTPLTIAALQETIMRVDALERNLIELSAA